MKASWKIVHLRLLPTNDVPVADDHITAQARDYSGRFLSSVDQPTFPIPGNIRPSGDEPKR